MKSLSAIDVRCAIFASALQQSDSPSADMVAAEITSVLIDLGLAGCRIQMAQEFGDHPEAAGERMQWAAELAGLKDAAALGLRAVAVDVTA